MIGKFENEMIGFSFGNYSGLVQKNLPGEVATALSRNARLIHKTLQEFRYVGIYTQKVPKMTFFEKILRFFLL